MREALAKAIYFKRMAVWSAVMFVCAVALFTFARNAYADFSAGEKIFIPGVAVLTLAVLLVFVMSFRFAVKNFKSLT